MSLPKDMGKVNEIAQVLKQQQVVLNPGPLDRKPEALPHDHHAAQFFLNNSEYMFNNHLSVEHRCLTYMTANTEGVDYTLTKQDSTG